MNTVQADQIYSDLRRQPDGTYTARCPLGWHQAEPGDALNFGNGVMVEILSPSMLGGGTFKLCGLAVLAAMAGLALCGWMGIGKGM